MVSGQGKWTSAVVFQKYYNRGYNRMKWGEILAKGIQWNSGSENNTGAFATNQGGSDTVVEEIKEFSKLLRKLVGDKEWSGALVEEVDDSEESTTNVVVAAVSSPKILQTDNKPVQLSKGESRRTAATTTLVSN